MKQQQVMTIPMQHIKKGNFVDMQYMDKHNDWQIYEVSDTKVHVRNLRDQNYKQTFDINTFRLRLFRTISKATEILSSYHRDYSYWSGGLPWALSTIKRVNQSADLLGEMSTFDLVQFWKGKNYLVAMSLNDDRKLTQDNSNLILEYVQEFLVFFSRYWLMLDLRELTNKDLYTSEHNAFMLSSTEIVINLGMILGRKTYLDVKQRRSDMNPGQGFNLGPQTPLDRAMVFALDWLRQKYLPVLLATQSFTNLNFQIVFKICSMLVKLQNSNRLEKNREVTTCIIRLIRQMPSLWSKTSFAKFGDYYSQITQLFQLIIGKQEDFRQVLKCKLRLLIMFQGSVIQYVTQPLERVTQMNKFMPFLIRAIDFISEDPEIKELILQFLRHQNGLGFYTENLSISNEKQLNKFFKLDPANFMTQAIKKRKLDILRLTNTWTPYLLLELIEIYLSLNTSMQKQDLLFSISFQKFICNQFSFLQRTMQPDKKFQHQETFKKLKKQITVLNARVICLCEAFCDTMEKTMIIEYVEKNILENYIVQQSQSISKQMEMKETNNFRQSLIYRIYINKYMPKTEGKSVLISTFQKLCTNLAFLKMKSHLEARKQNLITLLNKCLPYSNEVTPLICQYIQSVKKVQNKQFKNKALQFLSTFLNKGNTVFKHSLEERIESEKKIMSAMKIENSGQLRVFFQFFKHVNISENRLRLNEDQNIPLIIFKKPFGLEKLIEAFSISTDKALNKKLIQFFKKIQLKIADQALKTELMELIVKKLVEYLDQTVRAYQNLRVDDQYPCGLSDLIESLMFFHLDTNSPFGTSYATIFSQKNSSVISNSKIGGLSLSNTYSAQIMGKIESLTKKIPVLIQLQDPALKISLKDCQDNMQWRFEIFPDEKLFSLKQRACTYFQMSPIISNFYLNGEKIPHLNETMTVGSIFTQLKKQEQNKSPLSEIPRIDVEDIANNTKLQTAMQVEKMKENNQIFVLTLQPHQKYPIVQETLMQKIDVIYECLPYTNRIWQNLNIQPEHWFSHPLLIEVKRKFLEEYPDESILSKQYNHMTTEQQGIVDDWNAILEDPLKKKYLFEALLKCQKLDDSDWILESFNDINFKNIEIENNILSIELMQKIQLKLKKPEDVQKIFAKLRIGETDHMAMSAQQVKEIEKSYELLLDKIFTYIEAHAEFNLFYFILGLRMPINQSINYRYFYPKICKLLKNLFVSYIVEHEVEFFDTPMLSYISQHPNNFQLLLKAIYHISWEQNPNLIPIFENGLSKIVKLLILGWQNNVSAYGGMHEVNYEQLIELACCFICKNISCTELYLPEFRSILHSLLFSKQDNISLRIITCLTSQSISESEYYVNYFRKEMNDAEWEKKEYIKFHRSHLRPETGFVGLINPHSICYVNSLLQQLFHIEIFRRQLYEAKWKKHDIIEEDLIYQLKKIFLNLNFRQCEAYINRYFFQAFKNDEGGPTSMEVQMDVDEFRNILLDRIQNMVIKPNTEGKNFVQEIFNGKQLTIIKSKDCSHQSSREEDFSSICLEVKGLKNLDAALQHYFKPEILNEENKYFCENCNKKVVAEKRNVIKQYPKYLTFVLKRFEYYSQIRRKINERFEFPINTFQMAEGVKYSLKGVIVHQGLSEAGHYFSLVKVNKKWYQFNDNMSAQIYEANVMNYAYGESMAKSNKNAYLLLYEKVIEGYTQARNCNMSEVLQYQYGVEHEINQIKRYNNLVWKSSLFSSQQFQLFVETAVKNRIVGSITMLFQYITTVKAKISKIDNKSMNQLFELLETYSTQCLLSNDTHIQLAIKFYRNTHFHPSKKSALTNIIANKYGGFTDRIKKFLTYCIVSLHEELETSCFYYLFLKLSQFDNEVLKFLVSHRIIGRIYDISFPDILLTMQRQEVSKGCEINFPLTEKIDKKRLAENSQLRYHKWQFINYVLKSGVQLHRVQKGYIDGWSEIKCQQIFEEATCKSNINQISQFFTHLSTENQIFSSLYLTQISNQISKDKIEHLRKYLKATFDILNIKDSYRMDRFKRIRQVFSDSFRKLHGQKMFSSFDVKWQWFIKICYFNSDFRGFVRSNPDFFKILLSKAELNNWYTLRNELNSESKFKNKFYGLKFLSAASTNLGFLDEKIEKTKLIFDDTPSTKLKQIYMKQYNFDTTIIDFPHAELKAGSVVLKFFDQPAMFKEVTVDDVLGDLIELNNMQYDKGDEKFMLVQPKQIKMEEEIIGTKTENQGNNQYKIEVEM